MIHFQRSTHETIALDENVSSPSSLNTSYQITIIDSNENERTSINVSDASITRSVDLTSDRDTSSPQSNLAKNKDTSSAPTVNISKNKNPLLENSNIKQIFGAANNTASFFLGSQIGSALKMCTNQLSFGHSSESSASQSSNQTFSYQPQIMQLPQNAYFSPQMQQQSPLILPTNFNGTILYQPTIFLNTNKKLSDLINLQKSMEQYRQIVPKTASTPSPSTTSSPSSKAKSQPKNSGPFIQPKKT